MSVNPTPFNSNDSMDVDVTRVQTSLPSSSMPSPAHEVMDLSSDSDIARSDCFTTDIKAWMKDNGFDDADNAAVLFYYPHSKLGVIIRVCDAMRLQDKQLFNDQLIVWYLQVLLLEKFHNQAGNIHLSDTDFYAKLTNSLKLEKEARSSLTARM
ncbi:hypothetical protein BCR44DRAFT_1044306 [Catenaria anguillulae PL171]|uniref:Uncharacterized protein n=1 Tax=Catenaria anguillulae PL171 TaxID=765915 RepID=A0A1Y2HRZ3_9FUNG|nr:hypothetical protein BCR44DRAFT_1044306 [Catenaria anguillulae PL171]